MCWVICCLAKPVRAGDISPAFSTLPHEARRGRSVHVPAVKSSAAFWGVCSAVAVDVEKTGCATSPNACKISHFERGRHNARNCGNSSGHHDSGLYPYYHWAKGGSQGSFAFRSIAPFVVVFAFAFTPATAYPAAGLQPYWVFARLQGWLYRRLRDCKKDCKWREG